MTDFLILGPLQCRSAQREVNITGTLQRTLLAALLAAEPNPVSVDSLVVELWEDSPPPQWDNALQAHISRLRQRLHEAADDKPARLTFQHSAYRLLTDKDAVDAKIFMREVGNARLLGNTEPESAAKTLREALSLWRGNAFSLVTQGPLCRAAARYYEAARLVALETLFDLELGNGKHTDIIPMLTELVESSLLNERFCEQLMIALYRSGQQTMALSTYRQMRERLDAELGVEPTITLRNLYNAILVHHSALHVGADHVVLRA